MPNVPLTTCGLRITLRVVLSIANKSKRRSLQGAVESFALEL
jgi:hypothetical protein